ncbi:MAG: protein translocase subunit SecD [Spirochaetaceae bacterium]|nr:protein translocase subunit SecD [Spirochaetaceae bacterium]|tara:strand:+ start:171009 stop:172922 length:1914 start_codon:yes stop_codon:yes gene_type:complete
MNRIPKRTIVTLLTAGFFFLAFYPNLAVRDISLVFLEYYRTEDGTRVEVEKSKVDAFLNNPDTGLHQYFPNAKCDFEPRKGVAEGRHCVFQTRFITSAEFNELMQAYPALLDDRRSEIQPHALEGFFAFLTDKAIKPLTIKLGLDLQGGMRAIFVADYDTYIAKLKEKYSPVVADLNTKLRTGQLQGEDKTNAEARLEEIEDILSPTEERKLELLRQARDIIDKRLVAQGLTESEIRIQPGSYSIAVDMPGAANSSEVLERVRDTVTVEYRIVNDKATERIQNMDLTEEKKEIIKIYQSPRPDEVLVREIMDEVAKKANLTPQEGRLFTYWTRGGKGTGQMLPRSFYVLGPIVMDGGDMANARASLGQTAFYQINFQLTATGAEKFTEITKNNVGNRMAVLWGDRVVSAPVIQQVIPTGNGVINGQFGEREAKEVANVIREGALPLPLDVISVSYVGPTLGQESIEKGVFSVVLGFALIILFMLLYYRLTGIVALVALFLNLVLMAGILSLMEFTLTLPGFAGAILTVGMAVDANVLIFERIKEDLRAGKSASVAIDSGFDASFWTILDANVTTLIASIILYYEGDGAIKGFAIVLFFGIVSSMFTALYVSRLLFDVALKYFKVQNLSIGYWRKKTA